jgi:hypothetical protein
MLGCWSDPLWIVVVRLSATTRSTANVQHSLFSGIQSTPNSQSAGRNPWRSPYPRFPWNLVVTHSARVSIYSSLQEWIMEENAWWAGVCQWRTRFCQNYYLEYDHCEECSRRGAYRPGEWLFDACPFVELLICRCVTNRPRSGTTTEGVYFWNWWLFYHVPLRLFISNRRRWPWLKAFNLIITI